MMESEGTTISFSYEDLRNRIFHKLKEATAKLKELGYKSQPICPREFYDYMTGEPPTGDTITIADVLDNEFLMIHEVVEISELKKRGVPINKQTVTVTFPNSSYDTHYTATECELDYALSKKNYTWVKTRLAQAKDWLQDENLPHFLTPQYKALIQKFSKALEKK